MPPIPVIGMQTQRDPLFTEQNCPVGNDRQSAYRCNQCRSGDAGIKQAEQECGSQRCAAGAYGVSDEDFEDRADTVDTIDKERSNGGKNTGANADGIIKTYSRIQLVRYVKQMEYLPLEKQA